MKVADLKAALKKRSMSVTGSKALLVERLQGFINGDVQPEKKGANKRKASNEAGGASKKKKSDLDKDAVQIATDDFTQPALANDELKIISWNVTSFKSICSQGIFDDYLKKENPDILCLNETKVKEISEKYPGYQAYLYPSERKAGYSGVGLLTKIKPLSIQKGIGDQEHDKDGRVITAEFDNFYLVSSYIPNSGAKGEGGLPKALDYRMEWDKVFQTYLQNLDKSKPVIWCGDLNVAHKEIDLANPKTNKKTAGFTQQERDSFDKFLNTGFVDVHRHFFPDKEGCYTFWSRRSPNSKKNNIGWRLDYFVVSKRFVPNLTQSYIRRSVEGSDHCPIGIHIKK